MTKNAKWFCLTKIIVNYSGILRKMSALFPQLGAAFSSYWAGSQCLFLLLMNSHHSYLEPSLEGIKASILLCPFCNGCTLKLKKYVFQTLREKKNFFLLGNPPPPNLNECIKYMNQLLVCTYETSKNEGEKMEK